MEWVLLRDPAGRTGPENMALDDALLHDAAASGRAYLRLYRWAPSCLSFGRNEAALARYDRAAIEQRGWDVVRRPTGGRAVWHENEVTYAVAAPLAAFGSLRGAYREIHRRLAAALRVLGAPATVAAGRAASLDGGPCFATSVGGEVLLSGKKVIGSAQLRLGCAFLQHGSILLGGTQEMVRAVSRRPCAVNATTLSAALGRPVQFAEVVDAIAASWGDECTATALERPRPPSTSRFLDPAWTWRR